MNAPAQGRKATRVDTAAAEGKTILTVFTSEATYLMLILQNHYILNMLVVFFSKTTNIFHLEHLSA
jgi:hypothetical protein